MPAPLNSQVDAHRIQTLSRRETNTLFFTDGLTWKQRKSDLRKIVELQNSSDITRIYTSAMAAAFEADLRLLKVSVDSRAHHRRMVGRSGTPFPGPHLLAR